MLFGITCGLSAPYVAGQIDYAMQQVGQRLGEGKGVFLVFFFHSRRAAA